MKKSIAIIGHPLAAAENRTAFADWKQFHVFLVVPKNWRSISLNHSYSVNLEKINTNSQNSFSSLNALKIIGSGHNSWYLWVGLRKLLNHLKPDIIYCWEEPWCISTWQTLSIAKKLKVPLVFYSAENKKKSLPWIFSKIQKTVFKSSIGAIVPARPSLLALNAAGYNKRVHIIPLWIRDFLSIKCDKEVKTLAFVGRLISLKRVHLIIEALILLPNYKLKIVGDGPELNALNSLVVSKNLSDRVAFMGHIENQFLSTTLDGTSLLILPTEETSTQAEQFGKAALEGVSLGLPVLVNKSGQLAEWPNKFDSIFAFELNSGKQIAEAITYIFNNFPSNYTLINSKQILMDEFGPISVGLKLGDVFTESLIKSFSK